MEVKDHFWNGRTIENQTYALGTPTHGRELGKVVSKGSWEAGS